jgi:hypothetical protein
VDDDDFDLFVAAATGSAGAVPDGAAVPGLPLTIDKTAGDAVQLAWGPSCSTRDVDYAVYEGDLGGFTSHVARSCSTDGLTQAQLVPRAGSAYYLVVPLNGFREGSFGRDGAGNPRPPGAGACFPHAPGACE